MRALGVDPDAAHALLLTIRLYSFSSLRSVLRLLEDVGNTLLVLDEQTGEARLRDRMTCTTLVSSLVAPLVPDAAAEPIGVLNLRTSNPERRFREEQIDILRRLIHLASVALAGLPATAHPRHPASPDSS